MATEFAVSLKLSASGVEQQLRKLQGSTSKLDAAVKKTQGSFNGAANNIQKTGRAAQVASGGINKLSGSLKGLVVQLGLVAAAQKALQAGIGRVESDRRIQFLARGYGEAAQLATAASAASKKFGESQTEANKALADIYARLRPVGVSLKDIVSVYNGFNTAARISGASAVEASNAFRQLAQGLGSGALRGDEFNSIAEQVPGILTAISKETGVAQGKLREYAADGMITSDVVIRALKRIEQEGAGQLQEALDGPAQNFKDFQNAAEELGVVLSGTLLPAITPIVKGASELLREFGKLPGPLKTLTAAVVGLAGAFVVLAPAIKAVIGLFAGLTVGGLLAAAPWIAVAAGITALGVAAYNGTAKAQEFQNKLNDLSGTSTELMGKMAGVRSDMEKLKKEVDKGGRAGAVAKKKYDALKATLKDLQGTYKIRLEIEEIFKGGNLAAIKSSGFGRNENGLTYTVSGVTYDAATGKPVQKPESQNSRPDPEKDKKDKQKQLKDYTAKNQAELASNQIALDRQIFDNQVALDNQRYDLLRRLQKSLSDLWAGQFTGAGRGQAALVNQLLEGRAGRADELRQLQQERAKLEQDLKAAKAGVNIAQLRGQSSTIAAAGSLPQPVEYLTGDRGHSGYRADHGGSNYHEHIAYGSKAQRDQAMAILRANGIQIGSVNDGRHAPGSYHYSNQAFDVPASQVPVGQEEALSRRVRGLLGIGGGNIAPGGQANMAGVLGAQGSVEQVEAQITGLDQRIKELTTDLQKFESLDIAAFVQDSTQSFREQTQSLTDQTEALQLRNRLQLEGVDPSVIEGQLQRLQVTQELTQRVQVLASAEAEGKITQEQYAEAVGKLRENAEGAAGAIDKLTEATRAANNPINQRIGELRRQLSDTDTMIVSLSRSIESELGSAISNSISGLIDGTQTAEEAFSNMFKNIGKAFLDMAAQMLAQKLVLSLLQAFNPGGGFAASGFNLGGNGGLFAPGGSLPWSSWSGGGYTGDGPRAGGVDGQGGFPAILHPQEQVIDHSQMGDAMARYSRSSGNVKGTSEGSAGDSVVYSPMIAATTMPDGQQWVTVEQMNQTVSAGMDAAAKRGAVAGHTRSMSTLRNSRSQRTKLGL